MEKNNDETVEIGGVPNKVPYPGVILPAIYSVDWDLKADDGTDITPSLTLDLRHITPFRIRIIKAPDSTTRRPGDNIDLEWDYEGGVPYVIEILLMYNNAGTDAQYGPALASIPGARKKLNAVSLPNTTTDLNGCYIRFIARDSSGSLIGSPADSSIQKFKIEPIVISHTIDLVDSPNGVRSIHNVGEVVRVQWRVLEQPAGTSRPADRIKVFFATDSSPASRQEIVDLPGSPEHFDFPIPDNPLTGTPLYTYPSTNCYIWVEAFVGGTSIGEVSNRDGFTVNPLATTPFNLKFTRPFQASYEVGDNIIVQWDTEGTPAAHEFHLFFSHSPTGGYVDQFEVSRSAGDPMVNTYVIPDHPAKKCYVQIYADLTDGKRVGPIASTEFKVVAKTAPPPPPPPPVTPDLKLELSPPIITIEEGDDAVITIEVYEDTPTKTGFPCNVLLSSPNAKVNEKVVSCTIVSGSPHAVGQVSIPKLRNSESPIDFTAQIAVVSAPYTNPVSVNGQIVIDPRSTPVPPKKPGFNIKTWFREILARSSLTYALAVGGQLRSVSQRLNQVETYVTAIDTTAWPLTDQAELQRNLDRARKAKENFESYNNTYFKKLRHILRQIDSNLNPKILEPALDDIPTYQATPKRLPTITLNNLQDLLYSDPAKAWGADRSRLKLMVRNAKNESIVFLNAVKRIGKLINKH
jgi:hypothetical protein